MANVERLQTISVNFVCTGVCVWWWHREDIFVAAATEMN